LLLDIVGNEKDPDAFIKSMQCQYEMRKYADIIKTLTTEKFSVYDAEISVKVILLLSKSYYKTGDMVKAYSAIMKIKDAVVDPEDLRILFDVSMENKDINTAKSSSALLKNSRDHYPYTLFQLGVLSAKYGNNAESEEYLNRIISGYAASPYYEPSIMEISAIYIQEGNYTNAINLLKTVKSGNKRKNALFMLALVRDGNYGECQKQLRQNGFTISDQPESAEIYEKLLKYFYSNSDIAGMNEVYKYFSSRNDDLSLQYWFYNGKYYYNAKNYKNAVIGFNTIYKSSNPGKYTEALYLLARINYFLNKNSQTVTPIYEKLITFDEDEYVLNGKYDYSIMLYESGNTDKSKIVLSKLRESSNRTISIKAKNLYDSLFTAQ
jgi:hypothetical protein